MTSTEERSGVMLILAVGWNVAKLLLVVELTRVSVKPSWIAGELSVAGAAGAQVTLAVIISPGWMAMGMRT